MPKVLNTHHFGSVDKLPKTAKYIGRPSEHGNPFARSDGTTRLQNVVKHRLDLYTRIKRNPSLIQKLQSDLGGYDLACWCTQPKRFVACHGHALLHVLSDGWKTRDPSGSVLSWIMADLKSIIAKAKRHAGTAIPADQWLEWTIPIYEAIVEVEYTIRILKKRQASHDTILEVLMTMVVSLEAIVQETNPTWLKYRWQHFTWYSHSVVWEYDTSMHEPQEPTTNRPVK